MNRSGLKVRFGFFLLISCIAFAAAASIHAEMPVPSKWQGQISGQVQNTPFQLPVTIEIKQALQYENNPFHLFIGAGDSSQVGEFYLSSAIKFSTSSGAATLQYLTISMQGSHLTARLTDTHKAEAAKANGFTGPNMSAEQASALMKDIWRSVYGDAEMFGFSKGATVSAEIDGNRITGTIQGTGSSYTATASNVRYEARFTATLTR